MVSPPSLCDRGSLLEFQMKHKRLEVIQ